MDKYEGRKTMDTPVTTVERTRGPTGKVGCASGTYGEDRSPGSPVTTRVGTRDGKGTTGVVVFTSRDV